MYYAADRQTAERVLNDLRSARLGEHASALSCLQRLRTEVASERPDVARAQAWMSIRRLYDAFRDAPGHDLKPLWQDAISKTAAWGDSLHAGG
jgi:hypothetical protein